MTPHGRLLDRIARYWPLSDVRVQRHGMRQVSLLSLLLLLFGCRQRARYMPRVMGFRKTRLDFYSAGLNQGFIDPTMAWR